MQGTGNVFLRVRDLLADLEVSISGHKYLTPWERTRLLERQTSGVFDLIRLGLRITIRPFIRTMLLASALLAIGWSLDWLIGDAHVPFRPDIQVVFLLLFSLALHAFQLPSHAVLTGLNSEHVAKSSAKIIEAISDMTDFDIVREGVEAVQAACSERLRRIQWFLGILWAAIVWYATNTVLKETLPAAERSENILPVAMCSVVLLLAWILFSSYSTASRMVSLTIDFAFLDASSLLQKRDNQISQRVEMENDSAKAQLVDA